MRSSLRKGDQITTIGGVVGRIVKVDDDTIIIGTSKDRVRMEFAKWAVSTVGVRKRSKIRTTTKRTARTRRPRSAPKRRVWTRNNPAEKVFPSFCFVPPLHTLHAGGDLYGKKLRLRLRDLPRKAYCGSFFCCRPFLLHQASF